jgi:hypothetical protein
MIDQLKSIGIEKGKPFKPDAETKATFDKAAEEAGALLERRLMRVSRLSMRARTGPCRLRPNSSKP